MMTTRRNKSTVRSWREEVRQHHVATNSSVISGTPRMNSMKTTQIHLIIGMMTDDPAPADAQRNDSDTQVTPSIMFSMKPPRSRLAQDQAGVSRRQRISDPAEDPPTTSRRKTPPRSQRKAAGHKRVSRPGNPRSKPTKPRLAPGLCRPRSARRR